MPDESTFREMIRQYNEQLFALRPPAATQVSLESVPEDSGKEPKTLPPAAERNAAAGRPEKIPPAAVFNGPGRYIQGRGVLKNLGGYTENFGKKLLILASASGRERVENTVAQSLAETGSTAVFETFGGECSQREIDRVLARFRDSGCSLIAGVGGGKILDTAKAAAFAAEVPMVAIPTAASTGASCSAFSAIHTEEGIFERSLFLRSGPNLVLADTSILCAAPLRLLTSGMGNTLAAWHETRSDRTAAPARFGYEIAMADGLKAKLAAGQGACTGAVERVIQANLYLSALSPENSCLSGAHAIQNGLTILPETRSFCCGERAAFGVLVQLVLENAPLPEIEEILHFYIKTGLPTTLHALGVRTPDRRQLMEAAQHACDAAEQAENPSLPEDAESICGAILTADAIGRHFSDSHS